jgi:hypothetical protein
MDADFRLLVYPGDAEVFIILKKHGFATILDCIV